MEPGQAGLVLFAIGQFSACQGTSLVLDKMDFMDT